MSERDEQLRRFYRQHRIDDQLGFYASRREQFDRATSQGLGLSAMLLGFAAAVSALAGTTVGWAKAWAALAAILPALSTALAAYIALYAFDQQSKIYGDARRAVLAAASPPPGLDPARDPAAPAPEENIADLVKRVEGALRQEQGQWGQLTAQIQIADQTKG